MKYTLLEMVQDILSDMDSDEVNSIDDTVEAQQVAQIIKTCYFEMIANRNWPHLRKLIQLDPSLDTTRPVYLKIPEEVKELEFLRYDITKADKVNQEWRTLKYKEPIEFLDYVSTRNSSNDNVVKITDHSGVELLIVNDLAPTYWTSFDDVHLIVDSYDKEVDDTIKKSKTAACVYINPSWERMDESVPNLPIEAFPALLEEAKSTAFLALKQMANQKAEQKAKRQQSWLSRKAWTAKGGIQFPDYGRK